MTLIFRLKEQKKCNFPWHWHNAFKYSPQFSLSLCLKYTSAASSYKSEEKYKLNCRTFLDEKRKKKEKRNTKILTKPFTPLLGQNKFTMSLDP
jgi:hypothetical protein